MPASRKPRALQSGDTIAIVSPASAVQLSKLQNGVRLLQEAGYSVRIMPHAFDSDGHLAGPDAARAADLMEAFNDPEVRAILCSRGGYGCARLLPLLDLDAMAASGKLFLGFSDVTTLHLALNRRGLATVYAPMALSWVLERPAWVAQSFLAALGGNATIPSEAPPGSCLVRGVGEAEVTGGCLCLLADSLGTPDALDARGKILLIEDVDEAPHRVDAMLTHLISATAIQGASGIVVGEMTRTDDKMDEGIGGKPWREIVTERLEPLGVPTILDYPFGHAPAMLSLPLGVRARIFADEGRLEYMESHCQPTDYR